MNERFSQQTRLQWSADGRLSLDGQPAVTQPSNAFIFRLPNELLQDILCSAVETKNLDYNNRLTENYRALPLTLVCRKFYAIGITILYKSFKSSSGTDNVSFVPPGDSVRLLHRSLKEHPALRQHCRRLQVHRRFLHSGSSAPAWRTAYDLISWLINVNDLTIYGFREGDCQLWDLLTTAIEHMPGIQKLSFWRQHRRGLSFQSVLNLPNCSKLREVEICGVSQAQVASVNIEFICPEVRYAEQEVMQCSMN
jgi:hypothetical protein